MRDDGAYLFLLLVVSLVVFVGGLYFGNRSGAWYVLTNIDECKPGEVRARQIGDDVWACAGGHWGKR